MIRIDPAKIRVPLPAIQQAKNYDCGIAVLLSIMAYYGVPHDELDRTRLAKTLGTNRTGTKPGAILRAARRYGLQAKQVAPMEMQELCHQLDRRRPVVVSARAYGDGHYVAAVGYDRKRIYFRDPMCEGVYAHIERAELASRWWDYENGKRVDRLGIVVYRRSPPYSFKSVGIPE